MGDRVLLECPFCSGKPKLRRKNRTIIQGIIKRNTYVYCPDCDARGARVLYEDYEEHRQAEYKAIDLWNRRVK